MSQDLRLREDVERELEWESTIHSAEIGVGVKNGVVTLMGCVDSHLAKRAAERAAAERSARGRRLLRCAVCRSGPARAVDCHPQGIRKLERMGEKLAPEG